MTNAEIKEIVDNILVEEFEIETSEISEDAELFDDLELDSLDGIDLIVALEKAIKEKTGEEKKIEEEKAKALKTVGDIYKTIGEITA